MTVLSGVSRDDEDAAAVIAILTLLNSGSTAVATTASAWGDPAYALGVRNSWWTAGLPQSLPNR